jgi:serine/threonine-protein kinase
MSASSDRNLLLGMLALHAGLITREQLLEAFNAWMLDKEVALGEILLARGAIDADDCRMLDGLVERQIRRHGDARRSLAAMSAAPEARRDLEQLADADVEASLAATPRPEGGTLPPLAGPSEPAPPSGGGLRYRRLHLHAKGGLGEVHLALDEELRRDVALKEIQEQFADDADSRRRFVREALITGNLEHPGVVPIYGLLTDAAGRPVYAMRFIKGETLYDAIARFHAAEKPGRDPGERSLALRGLLSRFVAVCYAVGYAHARGVIHRDLKPQNVMLGEYGETLVVDWGLARVLAQSDPEQTTPHSLVRVQDADTATQLGSVLGTPAYMPPEQACGDHDRVGPASDVWALGATLYAILTGKAPYVGHEALLKANLCEFPAPRQVKPAVPRALEAVCNKAMAERPERRYATARALAAEVEHWLADEPVSAYREPVLERARRWGRRNRSLVASAVVLLLASVAGLSAGLWAVDRERARTKAEWERAEVNLGRAEEAERVAKANLEQARKAEREATANFEQARKAVDDCFGLAKDDPLLKGEHQRKVRQLLLKKTLPFYESFAAKKPDDEALLARQAGYLLRVGFVTEEIDRKTDALKSFEQAREILLGLVEAHPEAAEHQSELALTWNNLGRLQRGMGKPQEAMRSHERAKEIFLRLSQAHPEVTRYQAALADTWNSLGGVQRVTGKPEEELRSHERARDIQQRLSEAHPEVTRYQADLADTWNNLGILQVRTGKTREALKSLERARDVFLRLSDARPEVTRHQVGLAQTYHNLGLVQRRTGKPQEALRSYERARDIQQRLGEAHPEVTGYQADLALTWHSLALLQRGTGKPQEALRSHERARVIQRRLSQAHPEVTRYQAALAATYVDLSSLQHHNGQAEEALKSLNLAIPLLEGLRRREPRHPTYRLFLRNAHSVRADALRRLGRHRDALADWDEAMRLNAIPSHSVFLIAGHAVALAGAGDHRRAMAEVEDLARGKALPGESLYNLSCAAALSAAAVARDPGRPLPDREKQAEAWSRKAIELLQRAGHARYFRVRDNRAHLDKDDDLAFLRGRDDYAAFVKTLPVLKMPTPAKGAKE